MSALDLPTVEPVPLRRWEDQSIRIGESRITLPVFLEANRILGSAEALIDRFPTLSPGDIFGALSYYHRHRGQIDAYIAEMDMAASQIKNESEGSAASEWRTQLLDRARDKGLLE